MGGVNLLDNEFMLLKEDTGFSSPISVVFYEYYNSLQEVEKYLAKNTEKIQCVVSTSNIENAIPFGKTQSPELWDYADSIDTLEFLLNL